MTKVTLEFDYYEDQEHLRDCLRSREMAIALSNIREEIRGRIKWAIPEPTEEERIFLEKLRELMPLDVD